MIGPNAVHPVPRHPDGRPPVISSGFRTSDRPNHNGVDIMYERRPGDGGPPGKILLPSHAPRFFMPAGVPALAIAGGTVIRSEEISTGGYIVLEHETDLTAQYMHLFNRRVQVGDRVKPSEVVGDVGFDPSFKLLHLHFQLRQQGGLINPMQLLSTLPITQPPINSWLLVASATLILGTVLGEFVP